MAAEQLHKNYWIAIIEVIAAVLLAIILFPVGLIYYVFIQPLVNIFKYNIWRYLWHLIYQIYYIIMQLLHQIAFSLDLLGNVIVGDLIELLVTKEGETWFAKKEHSISQAFGFLQNKNLLNNFGKKVQKSIDFVFGKNHCLNAYLDKQKELENKETNENESRKID